MSTARPGSTARSTSLADRHSDTVNIDTTVLDSTDSWKAMADLPRDEVWATKRELREQARAGSPGACAPRGSSAAPRRPSLGWTDQILDPDILTIGFARRVPTYKRLTLMLRDPARLKKPAARPRAPDTDRHRRQVAPGRRDGQAGSSSR